MSAKLAGITEAFVEVCARLVFAETVAGAAPPAPSEERKSRRSSSRAKRERPGHYTAAATAAQRNADIAELSSLLDGPLAMLDAGDPCDGAELVAWSAELLLALPRALLLEPAAGATAGAAGGEGGGASAPPTKRKRRGTEGDATAAVAAVAAAAAAAQQQQQQQQQQRQTSSTADGEIAREIERHQAFEPAARLLSIVLRCSATVGGVARSGDAAVAAAIAAASTAEPAEPAAPQPQRGHLPWLVRLCTSAGSSGAWLAALVAVRLPCRALPELLACGVSAFTDAGACRALEFAAVRAPRPVAAMLVGAAQGGLQRCAAGGGAQGAASAALRALLALCLCCPTALRLGARCLLPALAPRMLRSACEAVCASDPAEAALWGGMLQILWGAAGSEGGGQWLVDNAHATVTLLAMLGAQRGGAPASKAEQAPACRVARAADSLLRALLARLEEGAAEEDQSDGYTSAGGRFSRSFMDALLPHVPAICEGAAADAAADEEAEEKGSNHHHARLLALAGTQRPATVLCEVVMAALRREVASSGGRAEAASTEASAQAIFADFCAWYVRLGLPGAAREGATVMKFVDHVGRALFSAVAPLRREQLLLALCFCRLSLSAAQTTFAPLFRHHLGQQRDQLLALLLRVGGESDLEMCDVVLSVLLLLPRSEDAPLVPQLETACGMHSLLRALILREPQDCFAGAGASADTDGNGSCDQLALSIELAKRVTVSLAAHSVPVVGMLVHLCLGGLRPEGAGVGDTAAACVPLVASWDPQSSGVPAAAVFSLEKCGGLLRQLRGGYQASGGSEPNPPLSETGREHLLDVLRRLAANSPAPEGDQRRYLPRCIGVLVTALLQHTPQIAFIMAKVRPRDRCRRRSARSTAF